MAETACLRRDDEVCLVEEVLTVRRVVVGRDRHGGAGGVDRTGKHVLVKLVVVAVAEPIPERHAGVEAVLEQSGDQIDRRIGGALRRVAKEGARIGFDRSSVERRDASIRDPLVVEVLVAAAQRRVGPEPERRGRIEAVALDIEPITVGV